MKIMTDGEANSGQFTTSKPVLMDVNVSEPEPIDIVKEAKSILQTIPCEVEPMAVDLEEEVQLNSSVNRDHHENEQTIQPTGTYWNTSNRFAYTKNRPSSLLESTGINQEQLALMERK